MNSADLLVDAYGRINELVHRATNGLTPEQLAFQIEEGSNSIAWLVWHLSRVQDDHFADAFDHEQIWIADGWADRFALPFEPGSTGYGHSREEVAAVQVDSVDLLVGYSDAVHANSLQRLADLSDLDLDRIIDRSWDPPVTLGVRLVSVISDNVQHAGQAAYVRGVMERS
jgi:uncharacterized damage-inducible protein DinB